MIIDRIKKVLSEFQDSNLYSEAAREMISIHIYDELHEDLNKKDERGL
tara:strand:- start:380 stop:523 length:144 start_codon:yes stop_codon:yes gene_type:complete